ncbi:MAG: RecQ family ATP-dependent DNA helicase, partial [Phycisphaerae bacterium]|nr:RecQ family ATP-dependent DNA helicase [Phycisphaerae bacterium]
KSLCYELPALLFDGLTVVISPLIALMKDQVEFLRSRSVSAARLDSSLEHEEFAQVHEELSSGRLRLLYISPERLGNERFLNLLGNRRISLLAVDEAHCISEWGHNFRPDYLKIARLAKQLGVERVLTLTATATPDVAADVAREFEISAADIIHTGFYRPNLHLGVAACSADERRSVLLSRIRERPPGPTVVYVTLQRTAEDVAQYLSENGLTARAYHAGMDAADRNEVQDAFLASDRLIVVATIAFGMGVDKANIRYVYHFNMPKSMESYMQEIGRAGRDGETATCELLACADDIVTLENFSYGDTPTPEAISALIAEVLAQNQQFDVSIYDLSARYDMRPLVVGTLLTYLELENVIRSTGQFYTGFKFQPQRPSDEILRGFDPPRAAFLESVFKHARKGRTWFSLDADVVSRAIGQPRDRIVKALDYLEEKGDLVLQASGVRHAYRRLSESADRDALQQRMVARFARREEQDIARIRRMRSWAEDDGCLTKRLLAYFGEDRDDCGHCARCAGQPAVPVRETPRTPPAEREAGVLRRLRDEKHAALTEPRQLARFLCGLTSPATTRAKLRGHAAFGLLETTPFAEVLDFVTRGT